MLELDHIVLGADSLEQGVAFIADKFGVEVPKGGEHLQMGTHNHVMSLGDGSYFEIIAIAPHLVAPEHARWFDLDNPVQQARLKERPRILTWVVRTLNLKQTLAQAGEGLGDILAMQRGDLSWQLSIRSDGSLPFQGLCPSLIEWQGNLSPAAKMTDLGCRLNTIQIQTTEFDQLNSALSDIGTEKFVQLNQGESNSIAIEFATPRGLVTLN